MFSMETYEEKIEALSEAFRIAVTREISEEVPNVCNLVLVYIIKVFWKENKKEDWIRCLNW